MEKITKAERRRRLRIADKLEKADPKKVDKLMKGLAEGYDKGYLKK